MKEHSTAHQPIVVVPLIVEPVPVLVPLVVVPVEVGDVARVVGVAPSCAKYRLCHCPSNALWAVYFLGFKIHQ